MSLEQARFNMIEQQIRPWGVLDLSVLETMKSIPRENFVPSIHRAFAFSDIAIPLGHGEAMMHPRIEGRLLQELAILPTDTCLEIGTGSGYVTACMASLAKHVHSVDIHEDFTQSAQNNLDNLGVANASLVTGDASQDWQEQPNHYNVIAITASMPDYNDKYEKKLKIGGRLFVVVGEKNMKAMLITRETPSDFSRVELFETELKALVGTEKKAKEFVF